ncbi:hypothetical protein GUI12_01940 [Anaplasmataceae bacterium AB001_6]|nr:hypothetical protein GUI12_01940 [Anaplasmataceae bacterium AB001_6]
MQIDKISLENSAIQKNESIEKSFEHKVETKKFKPIVIESQNNKEIEEQLTELLVHKLFSKTLENSLFSEQKNAHLPRDILVREYTKMIAKELVKSGQLSLSNNKNEIKR